MKGLIFDIEEFAVYDGPGIRTAVFFKGCPLRCEWCHNPEGLSFSPQIIHSPNGCTHCGACKKACSSPYRCVLCGSCIKACPNNLIRISGTEWEAEKLAQKLRSYESFYKSSGGGITFTGGEVLSQPDFLYELLISLKGIHRAIETSGYADKEVFKKIIGECDLIMFDLKLFDDELHKKYTGASNKRILENFRILKKSGKPFIPRMPLIPGVNDRAEHFEKAAELLADAENYHVEIELYNTMAGSKYPMIGREYNPSFDTSRKPENHTDIFDATGIPYKIL